MKPHGFQVAHFLENTVYREVVVFLVRKSAVVLKLHVLAITLYPIHSDTECLDTASGSANKQGDGENCQHLISLICIL